MRRLLVILVPGETRRVSAPPGATRVIIRGDLPVDAVAVDGDAFVARVPAETPASAGWFDVVVNDAVAFTYEVIVLDLELSRAAGFKEPS